MELHQLRYAVQVAEQRSFTRAAESLAVAQPSLSQQVRKLERELGFELFERSPSRVAITADGVQFLPYARAILAALDDATAAATEIRGVQRGTVTLGVSPIAGAAVLPPLLRLVREHYPGVAVHTQEAGLARLLELLREGALDLTLILLPTSEQGLIYTTVLSEDLVVVLPQGHALAGQRVVETAALRDERFLLLSAEYGLRARVLEECEASGFVPSIVFESRQVEILQRLVEAGLGVTVIPASAARHDLHTAARPIQANRVRPQRQVGLAMRSDRYVPLAARTLFELARERLAVQRSG